MTQGAQPSALVQARGLGDGREVEREGICVLLWLIHVDVAEAAQYCKAIIFQLKILKKKKKSSAKDRKPCSEHTITLP